MRLRLTIALAMLAAAPLPAADIFVAQAAAGGNTGANCANARATSSLVAGDWVASNVIHLCGQISSAITAQGSGGAGTPITVKFEVGASIQMPALPTTGALIFDGKSHFVVDGGGGSCGWVNSAAATCSQGFIQSTANGTGLANQVNSVAISASGTTDLTVKGILIGPIYLHTSTSDNTFTPPGPRAVYIPSANSILIENSTIHDCAWCINGNGPTVEVKNVEEYNFDHGVGVGGTGSYLLHDNYLHDMANWDNTLNQLHHDGYHVFENGGTVSSIVEYNNTFAGDPGANVTGWIYNEKDSTGSITGAQMFNNRVINTPAGRVSGVGWLGCRRTGSGAGGTCEAYDNTVNGAYVGGLGICMGFDGWATPTYKNNNLTGCATLVLVGNFTTATGDFNEYENLSTDHCGGSCNTMIYNGSFYATLAAYQTGSSQDSHARSDTLAAINMNPSGQQLAGSPLIGNATNLTSLSITALDSDILGTARPPVTAWDIGAYFGAVATGSGMTITPSGALCAAMGCQ